MDTKLRWYIFTLIHIFKSNSYFSICLINSPLFFPRVSSPPTRTKDTMMVSLFPTRVCSGFPSERLNIKP